uniref:Uncharacterized protein n=1 Tax=Caenorhabditis japonica TaxID=281687 RepID=A0A8R1HHX7_CAEJA
MASWLMAAQPFLTPSTTEKAKRKRKPRLNLMEVSFPIERASFNNKKSKPKPQPPKFRIVHCAPSPPITRPPTPPPSFSFGANFFDLLFDSGPLPFATSRMIPIDEVSTAKEPRPDISVHFDYLHNSLAFGEFNRSEIDCSRMFSAEWARILLDSRVVEPRFTSEPGFMELLEEALGWVEWEVRNEEEVLFLINKWPSVRVDHHFRVFVESHEATNKKVP